MIYDKGFVQYIHAGQNRSYLEVAEDIGRQVGGRVVHYVPNGPNDDCFDARGNRQAPPPTAPNTDRGKLLWEVQANHTRTHVTAHRWTIEANFGREFGVKMTGIREEIPQQLLDSYGKPPTPHVPKIFAVNAVHHELNHQFAKPAEEKFLLPPGISYADIGRQMVARMELIN